MTKRRHEDSDSDSDPSHLRPKSRKINSYQEEDDEDSEKQESGEEDSGEENSGEEEDSGEEEESGDDDDNADGESDDLTEHEKAHAEQKILANARNLSNQLLSSRTKAARAGGLEMVQNAFSNMNNNFDAYIAIKGDNKTIENIDSRNFYEAAGQANTAIRNIKLGVTADRISPELFAERIKHYILKEKSREVEDPEEFIKQRQDFEFYNWFKLGTFLHSRGSSISRTPSSLLEILKFEKKEKLVKQRAQKDILGKRTTAETVSASDINENSINQTPNQVASCFRVLEQRSHGQPINIFKFFINPNSFAQSIENMFYTSFLIRDGKLKLDVNEEGYPTVQIIPNPTTLDEQQRRAAKSSNHLIFQMEYESWVYLVKELNITESYIPSRNNLH